MGRCTVFEGAEEEAEFLFCFFRCQADGLEDALLYVRLVDTEGAAAEFDAVEDQVISLGIDVSRVAGTIRYVNHDAADDPSVVNNDPYGEGWLLKIELDDDEPELLDAESYAKIAQ